MEFASTNVDGTEGNYWIDCYAVTWLIPGPLVEYCGRSVQSTTLKYQKLCADVNLICNDYNPRKFKVLMRFSFILISWM